MEMQNILAKKQLEEALKSKETSKEKQKPIQSILKLAKERSLRHTCEGVDQSKLSLDLERNSNFSQNIFLK